MAGWKENVVKAYARLLQYGKILDSEQYQAYGVKERVYWVNSDVWWAGKYTLIREILLNRNELSGRSQDLQDYTFLHEVGHSRMGSISTVVLFVLRFVSTLFLLGLPFTALVYLMQILQSPVNSIPKIAVAYLILIAVIVGFYSLIAWIDEGYAELFVLSKIGPEKFRECNQEVRENRNSGVIKSVWHRLTYPRPGLVLWVYRRFKFDS